MGHYCISGSPIRAWTSPFKAGTFWKESQEAPPATHRPSRCRLIKYWGFNTERSFSTKQLIRRSHPKMMGLSLWNKLSLHRSVIRHHFSRMAEYLVLCLWKISQHNMPQLGFKLEITLFKSIIRWLVTYMGSQVHTLTTVLQTTTSFQLVVQKTHCMC